jgi:hypothetical protein
MKLLNLIKIEAINGLVLQFETQFEKDPDSIIKLCMDQWNVDHTKLPAEEFTTIKKLCTLIFCQVKKHVKSL